MATGSSCTETTSDQGSATVSKDLAGGSPWIIIVFMVNLLFGLVGSQVAPLVLGTESYATWHSLIEALTMVCLSFIMVKVGFEFDLDKSSLKRYGVDFAIAMSAAGLPALLVALWFLCGLPDPPSVPMALLAGLFAAPTSAGILFSMLEAAGLKETWLFEKARVLAVFDDLGTLLLLVPLKILVGGFSWELCLEVGLVFVMLVVSYRKLHTLPLPSSWRWTGLYALLVTGSCRLLHYTTDVHLAMEAIEMEVLLPAFCLGCIVKVSHGPEPSAGAEEEEGTARSGFPSQAEGSSIDQLGERVQTGISMVFMALVGLSMPSFFGGCHLHAHGGSGHHEREAEPSETRGHLGLGTVALHTLVVSVLMVAGKMVPMACYKKDADLKTRFALSLGMCPRGEVGAGVIVISLNLGMQGSSVTIAVLSLAVNLMLSSVFIVSVKRLLRSSTAAATALPAHKSVSGSLRGEDMKSNAAATLHGAVDTNEAVEQNVAPAPPTEGAAAGKKKPLAAHLVSPADGLPVLLGTASI